MKHTHGNWTIKHLSIYGYRVCVDGNIANVICDVDPLRPTDVAKGNAVLISAAPDMLKALYDLVEKHSLGMLTDAEWEQAVVAVRKATDDDLRTCDRCGAWTTFQRDDLSDPHEGQVCGICDEWLCNDCVNWSASGYEEDIVCNQCAVIE